MHDEVRVGHALGDGGVSPELDAVGAIERVAHGMIEVIVGEERADRWDLGDLSEGVHLKTRAGWSAEAFEKKAGVFAEEKAAIADSGEAFGNV